MNEEKMIALLRAFGLIRTRPMWSPYQLSKQFGLYWPVAKRWQRILEALPLEEAPDHKIKEISEAYQQIDAHRLDKNGKLVPPMITRGRELYGFPDMVDWDVEQYPEHLRLKGEGYDD